MIRSEWLRRQLQQVDDAIARLAGLRDSGHLVEAERAANDAISSIFGVSATLVEAMPAPQLLQLLTGDPGSRSRTALMLAELLRGRAEIQAARDDSSAAVVSYLRALDLSLEASESGAPDEAGLAADAVDAALDRLDGGSVPSSMLSRLLLHHERGGRFGRAEDCLFALLERGDGSEEAVRVGIAFYSRLRDKDEGELSSGNLPRDEVEEGLERLRHGRAP